MSLINQMLKDLEQRGAGDSDVLVAAGGHKNTNKLEVVGLHKSGIATNLAYKKLPVIKISLLVMALIAVVYFTVKNSAALLSGGVADNTTANQLAPEIAANVTNEAATKPGFAAQAVTAPPPLFATELTHQAVEAKVLEIKPASKPLEAKDEVIKARSEPLNPLQKTDPNKPTLVEKSVVEKPPTEKPAIEKPNLVERANTKPAAKPNMDNVSIGKQIRPDQKSGNFYRLAMNNLQQGRVAEAQANLTLALEANPANQEARQALAGLFLDNKRNDEAKSLLAAGLAITPEQTDFRMAIARLQVESGDRAGALNTLEQGLNFAKSNADYQSFLATLLQRAERHDEAITHYTTALSINNAVPNALIGLGISLQAVGKLESAQDAFTRAQASTQLSPDLLLFVEQRLKQINQRLKQ